jgi:hypothetical protein
MACISTARRTALLAELATLEALKTKYESALTEVSAGVESYKFDSGEGSQQTKNRSLKEIRETLDWVNSRIEAINRRLNGTGIVNLNLRRKQYTNF